MIRLEPAKRIHSSNAKKGEISYEAESKTKKKEIFIKVSVPISRFRERSGPIVATRPVHFKTFPSGGKNIKNLTGFLKEK